MLTPDIPPTLNFQTLLQEYYEMLALLMSRKLTLRSLWSWLLAPRARLGFLATLSEATRQGVFGGAVASTVVAFAQSGDLEAGVVQN